MKNGILGTVLWIGLAGAVGVGLFLVKHEVKAQERLLNKIEAEIAFNQQSVHVLRAEWAYLNDPVRLRTLAEKHLAMHPVQPTQVASLDQVLRDDLPAATQVRAAPRAKPSAPVAAPRALAARGADARPAASRPLRGGSVSPAAAPAPAQRVAAAIPAPVRAPVVTPVRGEDRLPAPAPAAVPVQSMVPSPARAGQVMVIRSPALAQSEAAFDTEGR